MKRKKKISVATKNKSTAVKKAKTAAAAEPSIQSVLEAITDHKTELNEKIQMI